MIEVFLLLFVVLRVGEVIVRHKTGYLWHLDRFAISFWIEMLLMVLPLLIFRWKQRRKDARWLFIGALCMVCGAAFWRLNYALLYQLDLNEWVWRKEAYERYLRYHR